MGSTPSREGPGKWESYWLDLSYHLQVFLRLSLMNNLDESDLFGKSTLGFDLNQQYSTRIRMMLVIIIGVVVTLVDPLSEHDYQPVKHAVASYKRVMSSWPRDAHSRLRFDKLEFKDEIYEPDSLEFDLQGRGPYTELADGEL